MEIMDKYVQTGEALAEKENEVVQLTKQVLLLHCHSTQDSKQGLTGCHGLPQPDVHQHVSYFGRLVALPNQNQLKIVLVREFERSPCSWSLTARSRVGSC